MILEVAILDVIPTKTKEFARAFDKTQTIIMSMNGYNISHKPQKRIGQENLYILLVQ